MQCKRESESKEVKEKGTVLWEPWAGKGLPCIWTLSPKPQSIQWG